MRAIGCGHKGGEANDDVQGAAFALGAAAIDCRLLLRGNEVGAWWSCGLEMVTAKSQCLTAIAVGEQPEVADPTPSCRSGLSIRIHERRFGLRRKWTCKRQGHHQRALEALRKTLMLMHQFMDCM
jgi:hypothetical protein